MQVSQLSSSALGPAVQQHQVDENASRAVAQDVAKASSAPVELPTKSVAKVAEAVNPASLRQATEKINTTLQMMGNNLQFSVDEDTGIDVVKVVDNDTKEVIRQIPSPEVLSIAKALDKLQGLLVKDKA